MTKKTKSIPKDIQKSAQQIWLAGLGALATAEEEGTKVFKNLVKKGERYEVPGSRQVGDTVDVVKQTAKNAQAKAEAQIGKQLGWVESNWERVEDRIDDTVATTLQRMGVPSRDEVKKLTRRIEQLTKKVEGMKPAKATRKTATKAKTTAKRTAKKVAKKATKKKATKRKTAKRTTAKRTAKARTRKAS